MFSLLVLAPAVWTVSFSNHKVYQVQVSSAAQAAVLRSLEDDASIDLWSTYPGRTKPVLYSVAPEAQESVLWEMARNGLVPKVVHHDLQALIDAQQDAEEPQPAGHQHPLVVEKDKWASHHTKYHTYPDIVAFYSHLAKEFPHLVEPFSIGTTYEGRDIQGWRLKGANATDSTPEFLYHGAIHAREWIGPAMLQYVSQELLQGYGTNPELTTLLDTFTFAIVPVLNVDGFFYTHKTNRMWRKNREPTDSFFCIGTDCNRNWDAGWSGPGASSNPCSDAYYGPSPFSAPESRAVSNYIKEKKPLSYIDWHAFSQLFMYPYGYDCNKHSKMEPVWHKVSTAAVAAIKKPYKTSFTAGPICSTIYEASGSSVDWAWESADVKYPFAIELRDLGQYGFMLPAKQIIPSGIETLAGIVAMGLAIKAEEGL
ncbi:Carboxypeptidase A4 [Kappamyces sp. JEL0829]|nr:Carboxypeptidase A4 [Kappamyces sp. JEL0829]